MRQSSHSKHRFWAFNTTRGVRLWTQLKQLDCVLDMTCKYLYLHLCFQTRIILLVCTLVCSHNIGLPMYLSGKLASLLACSLKLATWYSSHQNRTHLILSLHTHTPLQHLHTPLHHLHTPLHHLHTPPHTSTRLHTQI